MGARPAIDASTNDEDAARATREWVDEHVPPAWREAAGRGGATAIREVRTRADYEAWYPVFGASGLVAPTWPVECGGLGVAPDVARIIETELRPYNLGRLNPLGLNLCAPALFAHGTDEQRVRFLPPIVRNEERWCQLFSEPGAGSDLASLATRAERDGDEWIVTGQKVWTTWAHESDYAVLLARTDPACRSARASPTSCWISIRWVSTCCRSGTSRARSTSTRCSSTAHAYRTRAGSARSGRVGGRERDAVG